MDKSWLSNVLCTRLCFGHFFLSLTFWASFYTDFLFCSFLISYAIMSLQYLANFATLYSVVSWNYDSFATLYNRNFNFVRNILRNIQANGLE